MKKNIPVERIAHKRKHKRMSKYYRQLGQNSVSEIEHIKKSDIDAVKKILRLKSISHSSFDHSILHPAFSRSTETPNNY